MSFPPVEEQLRVINRGIVHLETQDELRKKLEESHKTGRPLRVKFGIDPSSPDIHVGHTVPLRKLRDFQRLGHQAIVLWGTATAMLGDPSGKNKTRPQLSRADVDANKATYKAQVHKVLDMTNVEERENSAWFDGMSYMDSVRLAGRYTVARILERDSFDKRYKAGEPISIHELLYPLMQGWDSVELKADVEIGGTDQLYNLAVGRDLQREEGQSPQIIMTTPIIEGLDGVQKMSKSLGNYIGVADAPTDMFGKCMSVPDALMEKYFIQLTDVAEERIQELIAGHPRQAKVALAHALVSSYHDVAAADAAVAEFDRMFKEGGVPDNIPTVQVPTDQLRDGSILVANALAVAGIAQSGSEGRRLIQGGGVKVDGEKVSDVKAALSAGTYRLQSGKRKHAQVEVP